jgi:hypothetical protein
MKEETGYLPHPFDLIDTEDPAMFEFHLYIFFLYPYAYKDLFQRKIVAHRDRKAKNLR